MHSLEVPVVVERYAPQWSVVGCLRKKRRLIGSARCSAKLTRAVLNAARTATRTKGHRLPNMDTATVRDFAMRPDEPSAALPLSNMDPATVRDFALRPDASAVMPLSPTKPFRSGRHERTGAVPLDRRDDKYRRGTAGRRTTAPMYEDVVDVLATDASGRLYGRRRCDDGAMYLGDFADDCLTREGWGMLVTLCGDTYAVRVGTHHPPHRRRDVDRRYHGEFKDGKPNGYGEMRYASGASHRGLWVDGEREGSGVFVDADGVKFDGAWTHDMPSAAE